MHTNRKRRAAQADRILELLRAAHGGWVRLPEILALGVAQYNSRVFELRRAGHVIENRTERINGVRHSWFRLLSDGDSAARPQPPINPPPKQAAPSSESSPLLKQRPEAAR